MQTVFHTVANYLSNFGPVPHDRIHLPTPVYFIIEIAQIHVYDACLKDMDIPELSTHPKGHLEKWGSYYCIS